MIIHVPNRSIICPDDPVVGLSTMSGWYKIEKLKVDAHGRAIEASRTVVADWFPNIITDQGLNRPGSAADWLAACQVGSGSAAPAASNTSLASFIAGSTTIQAQSSGAQASAPFFGWRRNTYRFAAGVGTGNLSEVGIGWAATGATLFSRALILDAGLNPTTITKLADEVLDVTYEIRNHPPTSDATGNITITGSGVHAFVTRAAVVTSGAGSWAINNVAGDQFGIAASTSGTVYNGAIGAVTATPSGSIATGLTPARSAYSNNSYQRLGTVTAGLNGGNVADGIRSILLNYGGSSGGAGVFQTEFTPPIPKTASNQLTLNVTHTWARRP
mgnify:CR=1 FL=1